MNAQYFSKFPKRYYDIRNSGVFEVITDISRSVATSSNPEASDSVTNYVYETIRDGERPDTLSFRLYGTANYYWTFFIVNESLRAGLRDAWPASSRAFEKMLENEYDPFTVLNIFPTSRIESRPISEDSSVIEDIHFSGNDLSVISFEEEFVPFLRLISSGRAAPIPRPPRRGSGGEPEPLPPGTPGRGGTPVDRRPRIPLNANILKYDASKFQLWISDINDPEVFSRLVPGTDAKCKIQWLNPYDSSDWGANLLNPDWLANREIEIRWMEHTMMRFYDTDIDKYVNYFSPPEAIIVQGQVIVRPDPPPLGVGATYSEAQYEGLRLFTQETEFAFRDFWMNARNAPNIYHEVTNETEDIETRHLTFWDAIKNGYSDLTEESYHTTEQLANEAKSRIRVVRPELIEKFASEFFQKLRQ
jgi:hypothetical protein